MQKLVSVIVPAYNSEKTIKNCVNSIQKQSYKNLEIIVVNDGSKDDTLKILNDISKDDNRVKVIDIPNGGVSHARNMGIDNAHGDYITFVDSDDTIKPDMYEHLLSLMEEYNAQITHCSYSNYNVNGFVSNVGNNGKVICQNSAEAIECLLSGRYFTGSLCTKLYSAELFCDLRLDQSIKINEDILLNYYLFKKVKNIVYSDMALYNYYNYSNSSTSTTKQLIKVQQSSYVAELMYNDSRGTVFEKTALSKYTNSLISLYRVLLSQKNEGTEISKKQLIKKIKKYKKLGGCTDNRSKLCANLVLYLPWSYTIIYGVYNRVRKISYENFDPKQ